MSFELNDCGFFGPALPEPFAKFDLEPLLKKEDLLPVTTGDEGKAIKEFWSFYRKKLRLLGERGGPVRVMNHVVDPLAERLHYKPPVRQEEVQTREGLEDGGYLLSAKSDAQTLRVWAYESGTDLDAPSERGYAYRYSPSRIAQRVLLAKNERVGLLTDGEELRILICDPARPDSHVAIRLDRRGGWRAAYNIPDSFRLFFAVCSPRGVPKIAQITDQARLSQTRVTAKLREQAKAAIRDFVQELLEHPENAERLGEWTDKKALAEELWREGLVVVYRLLFILKLEASADPARAFSFASQSLWRNTFSPNTALARHARAVLDKGAETGSLLEHGMRALFRMFCDGLSSNELKVSQLGGMLFGADATKLFDQLAWGERAVAKLLDRLLWTPAGGKAERERVHYGPLDVEDLGRVYEALLELEPGIATETMCRLRRQKLEVVVPIAQGEMYRATKAAEPDAEGDDAEPETEAEENEDTAPKRGKKTKVEWIEEITSGRFYLRVGLGRKSTGSYYTPHAFVRFLVQETLGPQVDERSPQSDPHPNQILKLNVLDPAMGSGHFLVEACRYLGDKLYEACRLCDELALKEDEVAQKAKTDAEKKKHVARAADLRARVEELPDPDDELVRYLPSRTTEGSESGFAQRKAEAISRRLVAVHCLYGVDKNPLAVELAKLSLWLESYAEGLPLTFLDHRLVCGDSLTGPFFEHLLTYPSKGQPIKDLFTQGLTDQLTKTLGQALADVKELEKTVGKDVAEVEAKRIAKTKLDQDLAPFKLLASAWSGGVMLGDEKCDDSVYEQLLKAVAARGDTKAVLDASPRLREMIATAGLALSYDLTFPEVFWPDGNITKRGGFDAVLGNPPWDRLLPAEKEFFGASDFRVLSSGNRKERDAVQTQLLQDSSIRSAYERYVESYRQVERLVEIAYRWQDAIVNEKKTIGKQDIAPLFVERAVYQLRTGGSFGLVVPAAIHINEGNTGIRRLLLRNTRLFWYVSFQNKKKIFDIVTNVKFDVVVGARDTEGSRQFSVGFLITALDWLFDQALQPLQFTRRFIEDSSPDYLAFLEITDARDLAILETCGKNATALKGLCDSIGMRFGREFNMTDDADRFTPTARILQVEDPRDAKWLQVVTRDGYLVVSEDDSIHQYTDHWTERPEFLTSTAALEGKAGWLEPTAYFRLMFRRIATVVDTRSMMAAIVPPGWISASPQAERIPDSHPVSSSLWLCAVLNSYPFDWSLRLRITATVNLFIVHACPIPFLSTQLKRYLGHAGLRLSCNHSGYAALWKEQLGSEWREGYGKQPTWPVLEGDDARWAVRAAIDAVVADAYGLNREQYEHVLSSFSHKSYLKARELCLSAFDELQKLGIEAFCKKHDPYWDIPLNEKLPEPVIELKVPEGAAGQATETRGGKKKRGQQLSLLGGNK